MALVLPAVCNLLYKYAMSNSIVCNNHGIGVAGIGKMDQGFEDEASK